MATGKQQIPHSAADMRSLAEEFDVVPAILRDLAERMDNGDLPVFTFAKRTMLNTHLAALKSWARELRAEFIKQVTIRQDELLDEKVRNAAKAGRVYDEVTPGSPDYIPPASAKKKAAKKR